MISRREFIVASGAALLPFAGCLSLGGNNSTPEPTTTEKPDEDGDGVPDSEDDYPDNFVAAEQVMDVSERVDLPPTEYKAYRVKAERDGMIKYDMISEGGPIDLFFLDRGDYDKWQKGDSSAEYRTVLSKINSASASTEQLLPKGEWVVVLDHTKGKTSPNEQGVTVDFSLEVAIESKQNAEYEEDDNS